MAAVDTLLPAMFHTSVVLERARQVTRVKKRKLALANIKKKAERLRKNPKPMAKKVEMMLKYKGLWGPPKPIRYVLQYRWDLKSILIGASVSMDKTQARAQSIFSLTMSMNN